MNNINIQKIVKQNGSIIEFVFSAVKDNGSFVEGVFSLEDMKDIINIVENTKSKDEKIKNFIDEKIKEDIKKDKSNIGKLKVLIEKWKIDTLYELGNLATYNDVIFECIKKHKSDYESIPLNNTEFWKKLEEEKQVEDGINPEWQENFEKAENYSRDKSYNQGEYVKFYNELYKAKKKITSEELPSKISEFWEFISKNI